ncbi:hypothetical protein [Rubrolithibacter danxiaensis]|uniref:hypothetical protein n=1 Tax=Rubrolithibacter danxiaensis TaxID=3390805 RepID=UPI003BF8686A
MDDLTSIAEYSSSYSNAYASSIVLKLFRKTALLKTMPRAGRIVKEKTILIYENYLLIKNLKLFPKSILRQRCK